MWDSWLRNTRKTDTYIQRIQGSSLRIDFYRYFKRTYYRHIKGILIYCKFQVLDFYSKPLWIYQQLEDYIYLNPPPDHTLWDYTQCCHNFTLICSINRLIHNIACPLWWNESGNIGIHTYMCICIHSYILHYKFMKCISDKTLLTRYRGLG